MTLSKFVVKSLSGGIEYGDAIARQHDSVHFTWSSNVTELTIGIGAKTTSPEFTGFVRYDLTDPDFGTAIPPGATVTSCFFGCFCPTAVPDQATGKFRIGILVDDSVFTHASSVGFKEGAGAGEYQFSYLLPFPTLSVSDVIRAGKIEGDVFLGTVTWDATWASNVHVIGDDDVVGGDKFDEGGNPIADAIEAKRAAGESMIGFVLDAMEMPNPLAENRILFRSADHGGAFPFDFAINYDEGVPTITSDTGPVSMDENTHYTHTVTATDPASVVRPIPDPVEFTLDDPPYGMTIGLTTGIITWYPGPGRKNFTINIIATDEDGFTDTQSWDIVVHVVRRSALETELANTALGYLGHKVILDLEGQDETAQIILTRYDDIRDTTLREIPWKFAKKREHLAASAEAPAHTFANAYNLPSDCLRVLEVGGDTPVTYRVEGRQVVTNSPAPLELLYLSRITNPLEWDAAFWEVFALELAVELASAITGDNSRTPELRTKLALQRTNAMTINAQEEAPQRLERTPGWTGQRGGKSHPREGEFQ